MDPLAETVSNSFGPRKVCGNSTTNQFHSGKQGPRADLAQWPDHYKLQGPLFSVTHYGVISILFRILIQTLVAMRKWFLLLLSTNILEDSLTKPTALTGRFSRAIRLKGLIWQHGIIFILMEMISIPTEVQLMAIYTTVNSNSQFKNGLCTTLVWLNLMVNLRRSTKVSW